MKHGQQDFWSLVTTFIVAATAGMLFYNFLCVISMHHSAVGRETSATRQHVDKEHLALQLLMETRVCESPATGAYLHVNVTCLQQSPTARWMREYIASGGKLKDMVVHVEQRAASRL
eukprot:GHRR01014896.1.p1 GENE.GHRR01014896.1~~GHRR01014896.1.p1  ORF type:complete len:117 (+),score=21.63 GHRR01014896.1:254-604(+)